eukprot:m.242565 g.242565  ORF g.242565 m.242565 type:complete len:155 (-) comp17455_c1_seq46:369-833(-)
MPFSYEHCAPLSSSCGASAESVEREMKMLNYKADAKVDKEFANQEGPQGVLPEYPAPVPMQQPCPRPTAAAAQATVPVTLAGVQVQPLQPAAQAPQAPQAALQAHSMHNTLHQPCNKGEHCCHKTLITTLRVRITMCGDTKRLCSVVQKAFERC